MAIQFHCEHCGKVVKTGDEHAGKRGRCPHCKNSVYIPTPSDELEPLDIKPIDEEDERERERLKEESRDVVNSIRHEKDPPPEAAGPPSVPEPVGDLRLPEEDVESLVIEYAQCMSNSRLEEADKLATRLRQNPTATNEVVERFLMDEIPPKPLQGIPRQLLNGFLRQLKSK